MKKTILILTVFIFIFGCSEKEEESEEETGGDKYTTWKAVPNDNFSQIKYRIHCSAYTYSTGSYWEVQMKNESSNLYIKADAEIDLPVYNGTLWNNGLYKINPGGEREYIGNTNKSSEVNGVQNCDQNYSALIGVWSYDSSWNSDGGSKTFEVSRTTDVPARQEVENKIDSNYLKRFISYDKENVEKLNYEKDSKALLDHLNNLSIRN